MISVKRTFDYELVRKIMTHPAIYRHISDDGSPPAEQFRPQEDDRILYLALFDDAECFGVFMLHPHNTVCWEIHTCILPTAWGDAAKEAAQKTKAWIFDNTPCERIITNVPEYNQLAKKFAIDGGMSVYGTNPKSIKKRGVLRNQILLGVSKEDWQCQQQYR